MNSTEQEQEQSQKLAEIGSYLKKVRQQQSMSLEEIASKTLIAERLLRAIEDCELEELPEPIYIRGFIRRFADTLGVNGTKLADAFPMTTFSPSNKSQEVSRRLPRANLQPIHLYVLYVLLIVGAVSGLSYLVQNSSVLGNRPDTPSDQSTVDGKTQPSGASGSATPKANSTKPAASSPKPAANSPKPKPAAPLVVHMSVKQDSWMRIMVDGKNTFEGILPTGTNKSIAGQKSVVVLAGNAGGVLISEDGQPAEVMGQPGATAEKTFQAKPPAAATSPSPNATASP